MKGLSGEHTREWAAGNDIDARNVGETEHAVDESYDAVLSFGGDGTMLRTVDLVAAQGTPVLGINVGQLGYLAHVEPADMQSALARFLAGDYATEERLMLDVQV